MSLSKNKPNVNPVVDRDATKVWKRLHEAGHFIEMNGTEDNESVIIYHSSGSKINFRPDGNVEIYSTNDMFLIAEESLIVECKRFVIDAKGGENHRSDYHNHILFNGDVEVEINGKVQSNINRDHLHRVGGKYNFTGVDIVSAITGTETHYAAHIKNGTQEKPINSQINHIKSQLNYIEGEQCVKTDKDNGNVSFVTPGRANIKVGEDMITEITKQEIKTVGKEATHIYKDKLQVKVEDDRLELMEKDYTVEVKQTLNITTNALSLNILSGGMAKVLVTGNINIISSQSLDLSALSMIVKSPSIDFNDSQTSIENLPEFNSGETFEDVERIYY